MDKKHLKPPIIPRHFGKLAYYIKNIFGYLLPKRVFQKKLPRLLSKVSRNDGQQITERVNYYNKLNETADGGAVKDNGIKLADFKYIFRRSKRKYADAYFFDTYQFTRFFGGDLKILFDFEDIRWNKEKPTLTKTRAISGDNSNNVILKLDKFRHFSFVKDGKDFAAKKNKLIGRGNIWELQQWRIDFYNKYFGHKMCDLGVVNNTPVNPKWIVKPISRAAHLEYKFILCLEGNDVATNLKWVMGSNSLAVMPKPKCESWFMEGRLIGGVHYVELKDDYSDLEERLNYYIERPDECLRIIENAHAWVGQFFDEEAESLCSLLTLQKYFRMTGQI